MFQSAALAAALCVVLTAIFAMHNAHELHVASLERQIEDARAHTTTIVDTLERRISILDAQIERARTDAGDVSQISKALTAMEHSAQVRHLRELKLTPYDGNKRLDSVRKAKSEGFTYDVMKEVYPLGDLMREGYAEACSDPVLVWDATYDKGRSFSGIPLTGYTS